MAKILLLPVSENEVRHIKIGILLPVVIFTFASSSACHSASVSKFRPNQTIRDIVMTWYPVSKMAATARNFTSGFVFRDFAHLGKSKSTCRPNFGEISQSTAELLLLPVSENKCPPCWNSTSGFNFTFASLSGSVCHSASAYQISSKLDHPRLGMFTVNQLTENLLVSKLTETKPKMAAIMVAW